MHLKFIALLTNQKQLNILPIFGYEELIKLIF